MQKLFAEDDSDSEVHIKTNTDYATHYNTWRQKEELNKLKTKYGDINDALSDDGSTSEDDEDGRELTQEFEKNFFKTLSCLKNKDPRIYDSNTKFFKDKPEDDNVDESKTGKKKEKKKNPLFLKDYEKKMVMKTGGKFEEDTDEDNERDEDSRSGSPTYVEEQRRIKESLKNALNDEDDGDNNWGGLFQKRNKTKEDIKKEEEDYTKWLKGNMEKLEDKDEESDLKPLKEYWNNPKLDESETFLRDYLLNKKYLENPSEEHIPTYEEIIHDSDDGLSEDEKEIEKQEEFELKYNFRYEEPDQEYIKRYPRTMDHSVRKTDDRRKLKRLEIKERKEQEKKQKQEELMQLKSYKRKEIEEKINKLKEITGNNDIEFLDDDIEGDFDPEAHDKRMQELFDNEYYDGAEDTQKPNYPDLDEELGPWKYSNELHCEDENFNMDCDYDPNAVKTETEKGKKKRNRFDKEIKKKNLEKPEFDENDERYEQYMDELYKLDYEDMIGDLPCRFKYRDVIPNNFGLSVEEILLAKDRELNRWCSLKKTTQYRPDNVEKYDVIAYERKGNNEELKRKILTSLYAELDELKEDENIQETKGELKQNEKKKKNTEQVVEDNIEDDAKPSGSKGHKIKPILLNNITDNIEEKETNSDDKEEEKISVKQKKRRKRKLQNTEPTKEVDVKEKNTSEISTEDPKETVAKKTGLTRRQKKNKNKVMNNEASKIEANTNKTSEESSKINRKRKRSETTTKEVSDNVPAKKQKGKKKKSKINKKDVSKVEIDISNSRLEAYGINPKKYKNTLKYGKVVV